MMFHYLDGQDTSDGKISVEEWITGMETLHTSEPAFNAALTSIEQALAARAMAGNSYASAADASPAPAESPAEVVATSAPAAPKSPSPQSPPRSPSMLTERHKLLKKVFLAMDVDGDGSVDLSEFKRTSRDSASESELAVLFQVR